MHCSAKRTFLFVFSLGFGILASFGQSSSCPSLDIYEILMDSEVQKALDEAWVDSQEGTPGEHEEGGWITHEYREGTDNPCKEYVTKVYRWPSGTVDGMTPTPRPSGENIRVVAEFHTHPGPANDSIYTNHIPSLSDLRRSDIGKIPGIIRYGSGPTSAQTFDIIYDGSEMINYDVQALEAGIRTWEAGFYDTRIASRAQLQNAGYMAKEPEWECEEVSALPSGSQRYQEAFEKYTGVPRNPLQHKERPLEFDYRMEAQVILPSSFNVQFFANSADGSIGIFEEDIGNLISLLGAAEDTGDFKMHYVVLGTNEGGMTKMGYYGESEEVFEGSSPLVGLSVMTPSPPTGDCMLGRLIKTDEYTSYKGEEYPWYRLTTDSDEETLEVLMAMKPTLMTSQASDFRSLVGILKDPGGKQNYLVVEFKTEDLHIKLRQIERLETSRKMDLSDYTVLTELNTLTRSQRFDEQEDMEDVMAVIQNGYEQYEECVRKYRGTETEEEVKACWDRFLAPVRKEYPHLVPPFEY